MSDILANLLSLQQEIREIQDIDELAFFMTHQSKLFASYQRSVVWSSWRHKSVQIKSISGVTQLNKNSPYQLDAHRFIRTVIKNYKDENGILSLTQKNAESRVAKHWIEDEQENAFVYFFRDLNKEIIGGIILFRDRLLKEKEIKQFEWIAPSYNQAWSYLSKPRTNFGRLKNYFRHKKVIFIWVFLALFLIAMFLRVPQSVLAPATIVAKDPVIITVPMTGVVQRVRVSPGQVVHKDELLFDMDKRDLVNANELAQKELITALAKYKSSVQSSYQDVKHRAELKVLSAEVQEKTLEVNYTAKLLSKSDVRSPTDGIAVIDNPHAWVGKPVVTGENVMQVAIPNHVEIEIWLPVSDAISFKSGAQVKLFLNSDPLHPIYATLEHSSFVATITPSQILAYHVKAYINPEQKFPRIGSQGTAKIIGDKVSLFYYLFRRPITTLRQYFGW